MGDAAASAGAQRSRYLLKHDADVMVKEPAPHGGVGETTAYRYFDELHDAGLIFRKRALHRGAANGVSVLKHDEVYYALRGRGELEVDGARLPIEPGTAVFMYRGATIRLRQVGDDDLVVIIAYPPAERPR
jgi:mannose-6-phosphate isomerase-like protein (cupin superfamily)